MSKKIECRLPDQLYIDLKARCQDEGITVTDAVISNVSAWLYNNQPVMTEHPSAMLPRDGDNQPVKQPYKNKPKARKSSVKRLGKADLHPDVPISIPIDTDVPVNHVIKSTDDVSKAVASLPMRSYFNPVSKASQLRNAGKAKG